MRTTGTYECRTQHSIAVFTAILRASVGGPEDISETIDTAVQELGGDKSENWKRWYKENIPIAEQLYLDYTTEAEE